MKRALLIGCGAIGRVVLAKLAGDPSVRVTHVLETPARRAELQRELGDGVTVVSDLAATQGAIDCAIECAGHGAVVTSVIPLLERGVDVALVSVGALAEEGLPERLEAAARAGGTQLTLVSGAIGAIDAIAAARIGGLDEVIYTGRKPPLGWVGSPAEKAVDLKTLARPVEIFEGSARDAARLYPKNANVAATLSLAGLGLDRTRVTLIADPGVTRNVHRVAARGAFGDLDITLSGEPLPGNPKTSSLAAYSAVRALRDLAVPIRF
ncbi:MAG TPA: aspartate dehydrogenase [Burkholderiales bacterium]|nr:aspartate dehydrogenase [Burkholderiales bacterium]